MSEENHAETIARLALDNVLPTQVITVPDGRLFAIRPSGQNEVKFDDITLPHLLPAPKPQYVQQTISIDTVESLIGYANRFKNASSTMFASIQAGKILAVIDYHKPSTTSDHSNVSAELCRHIAALQLLPSEEWKAWLGNDGKWMSHVAFANWLEERSDDIIKPAGTELLELCRDLQGTKGHAVRSSTRDGSVRSFEFQKDNNVSSKTGVAIPERFEIEIPVYFGEPVVNMRAMMRYEVDDDTGGLKLGYKLLKVEMTKQEDFHRVVEEVRSATELHTFYGSR